MKPTVNIFRMKRSSQGTLGMLCVGGFRCYTLELPWKDNKRNVSCIPRGSYKVETRLSPKFGNVYWVREVPERTFILIHSGNWAGDISEGFKSHANGCILLGQKRGLLANQLAVLNSGITVRRFMRTLQYQPFTLDIHEEF